METSSLIYRSNQRTGFYMIGTSVMKGLNVKQSLMYRTLLNIYEGAFFNEPRFSQIVPS